MSSSVIVLLVLSAPAIAATPSSPMMLTVRRCEVRPTHTGTNLRHMRARLTWHPEGYQRSVFVQRVRDTRRANCTNCAVCNPAWFHSMRAQR
jgi:hypothetical protein